jgi:hypothetical protein
VTRHVRIASRLRLPLGSCCVQSPDDRSPLRGHVMAPACSLDEEARPGRAPAWRRRPLPCLSMYVYARLGLALPHGATAQQRLSKRVPLQSLRRAILSSGAAASTRPTWPSTWAGAGSSTPPTLGPWSATARSRAPGLEGGCCRSVERLRGRSARSPDAGPIACCGRLAPARLRSPSARGPAAFASPHDPPGVGQTRVPSRWHDQEGPRGVRGKPRGPQMRAPR